MDRAGCAGEPLPVGRGRAALLFVVVAAAPAAATTRLPRLATMLGRARLVVTGAVTRVEAFDHGRVTVGYVHVVQALKGTPGPADVPVVEEHDLGSSVPLLRTGDHVVAFLVPAGHSSALAAVLPRGPAYFRLLDPQSGLLASNDGETIREAGGLVARMVEASTSVGTAAREQERSARTLVFDEIAAHHPRLVVDGGAGLSGIPGLGATLSDDERRRLAAALERTDLAPWVRVGLVNSVAEAKLTALAPTLHGLDKLTPEVLSAVWTALGTLGQRPSLADLRPFASNADPAIRAVVPAAMMATHEDDAIGDVERIALGDHDLSVRRAAIAALGASHDRRVLPSLERVYRAGPAEVRPAVAQAFLAVGGHETAEVVARLAMEGPADGQTYAATLLLAIVPPSDPLVVHLREAHPDPELRSLLEHGPYLGHHHD